MRSWRYSIVIENRILSFASCYIYAFPRRKKYMQRKKTTRFPETWWANGYSGYRDSNGNGVNLRVAAGEHIVLRRGPGGRDQRFEAGEEVNASLAQPATIGGVRPVQ